MFGVLEDEFPARGGRDAVPGDDPSVLGRACLITSAHSLSRRPITSQTFVFDDSMPRGINSSIDRRI
jgi:hypothetical protein